jgi:AraC-like DNA-binding protein
MLHSPRVARGAEDTLAAMVVGACLHGLPATSVGPAYVRRAEEFLVSQLGTPVSLAEVGEVAGISTRTLSRAFRQRHGVGVMGFLKRQRMEAVRRDLLAAEPGSTTVTEVALRYCCTHLGRFSAEYRRRFGELPSDTLRR